MIQTGIDHSFIFLNCTLKFETKLFLNSQITHLSLHTKGIKYLVSKFVHFELESFKASNFWTCNAHYWAFWIYVSLNLRKRMFFNSQKRNSSLNTKRIKYPIWKFGDWTRKLQEIECFKPQCAFLSFSELYFLNIGFLTLKKHIRLHTKRIKYPTWKLAHRTRKLQTIECFKSQCAFLCLFEALYS